MGNYHQKRSLPKEGRMQCNKNRTAHIVCIDVKCKYVCTLYTCKHVCNYVHKSLRNITVTFPCTNWRAMCCGGPSTKPALGGSRTVHGRFLSQWCPWCCVGTTLESVEVLHQDTISVPGTLFGVEANDGNRYC